MGSAAKPPILLTDPRSQSMVAGLADEFTFVAIDDEASVERERGDIRAVLFLGYNVIPAELLDRFPRLELLVTPSSGIEGVDLAAAERRGITVTSGGDTHSRDVASYAIALAVAARHKLLEADRHVRSGDWRNGWPPFRQSMTADRIGIVGLGAIGRAVAEGISPLCRAVAWHGPSPKDVPWQRFDSLPALAEWCDVLILCARSDSSTAGLIDAGILEAIGPGGLFVNIARGFMVDEEALIGALRSGRLGGAALDVFVEEPTEPDRWKDVPNTVLSPHVGGMTHEARQALIDLVHFNLRTLLTGNRPRQVVVAGNAARKIADPTV